MCVSGQQIGTFLKRIHQQCFLRRGDSEWIMVQFECSRWSRLCLKSIFVIKSVGSNVYIFLSVLRNHLTQRVSPLLPAPASPPLVQTLDKTEQASCQIRCNLLVEHFRCSHILKRSFIFMNDTGLRCENF